MTGPPPTWRPFGEVRDEIGKDRFLAELQEGRWQVVWTDRYANEHYIPVAYWLDETVDGWAMTHIRLAAPAARRSPPLRDRDEIVVTAILAIVAARLRDDTDLQNTLTALLRGASSSAPPSPSMTASTRCTTNTRPVSPITLASCRSSNVPA